MIKRIESIKCAFIIAIIICIMTGCAGQQIKSGNESLKGGDISEALCQYFKAANNKDYSSQTFFKIGKIYEEVLYQFDLALNYYSKAYDASKLNRKSKNREFLLKESKRQYKIALENKFNNLEKEKVLLFTTIEPKSKYYSEPSDRERHVGKTIKFEKKCKIISIEKDWLETDECSGYYYHPSRFFNIKSIEKINIILPRDLSKYDSIIAYRNFLKEHPKQGFDKKANNRIDSLSYEIALGVDSIQAYENYLNNFPDGAFASKAEKRVEELFFNQALNNTIGKDNKIKKMERYLLKYPGGNFVAGAKSNIEELYFKRKDTISSYKNYLLLYPTGRFALKATKRIEELYFQKVKNNDIISSYESYLEIYPNGKFTSQAKLRIEELYFQKTKKIDTIDAYKEYLSIYPEGKYIAYTEKRIEEILDENAFGIAKNRNSIDSYKAYLEYHPEGKYIAVAKGKILYFEALESGNIVLYKKFFSMKQDDHISNDEKERLILKLLQLPESKKAVKIKAKANVSYPYYSDYTKMEINADKRILLQDFDSNSKFNEIKILPYDDSLIVTIDKKNALKIPIYKSKIVDLSSLDNYNTFYKYIGQGMLERSITINFRGASNKILDSVSFSKINKPVDYDISKDCKRTDIEITNNTIFKVTLTCKAGYDGYDNDSKNITVSPKSSKNLSLYYDMPKSLKPKNVVKSSVGGAIIGGLLGAFLGGDKDSAAAGAALGGAGSYSYKQEKACNKAKDYISVRVEPSDFSIP
ncbi:hypothetical protein QUF90_22480 [Desulfococcaceae bacterium HSG9]|nr:hypothetical protein [Desulfococcaceae bacterium HSG9]